MRRAFILGTILLLGTATAAIASHPGPREMRRVRALAHDLERAAERVHHRAERQRHHFDRREESAFRSLHRLADESRHFHRQTERFFRNPTHTKRDFRDVVRAYVHSVRRLDDLHGTFGVERDFQRVGNLVIELDRYYGFLDHHRRDRYRGRYGHRFWRHGGFDRGLRFGHRGFRGRGHHRGRGRGHLKDRGRGHHGHGDPGWRRDHRRSRDHGYDRDRKRYDEDRRRRNLRDRDDRRRGDSRDLDRDRREDRRGARDTRPN